MYFPYLRGKRYELLAQRELADFLAKSGKILPIVEPVNEQFGDLINYVREMNAADAPYALVVNPTVGELKGQGISRTDPDFLPHDGAFTALIITNDMAIEDIGAFLREGPTCKRMLIHAAEAEDYREITAAIKRSKKNVVNVFLDGGVSESYAAVFKSWNSVLIRDPFHPAETNADYRPRDGEFFSDLHLTFKEKGFMGFGDYLTIGRRFREGGSRPKTVAVHVTFKNYATNDMRIRHFVSDKLPETTADIDGKVQEALNKMRTFRENNEEPCNCDACEFLMASQKDKAAVGLGLLKKLSMKHHIVLTGSIV